VGVAAYAEMLVEAISQIKTKLGKETLVAPLPPLLLGGCTDAGTVRSIFELITWSDSYFSGTEGYLEESTISSLGTIKYLGSGSSRDWEGRRVTLPCKEKGKQAWSSGGNDSRAMPCSVRPLTASTEKRIICKIIAEIRSKLALDLDPTPTFDRVVGAQSRPKKRTEYIVVGSSNARRTSKVLERGGINTHLVFSPNWRIGKDSCELMAAQLAKAVGDLDPDVVVLQLFDSSCFFARTEDGSRIMPKKQPDGRFHILGELVVCPVETQLELLNTMKPIFDAMGHKAGVFVTPMPRYVTAGCCEDPSHVSNREDRHFRADMDLQLDSLKRTVKNFLFNTGRRNFRILDTGMTLKGLEDADLWCTDPVHPIESVYGRIAEGIKKLVDKMQSGGGGVGRGGGGGVTGNGGGDRSGGGGGRGWASSSLEENSSGRRDGGRSWSDGGAGGRGGGRADWRPWSTGTQWGRGGGGWGGRGRARGGYPKRRREDTEEEDYEQNRSRHRPSPRYMAHGHINQGGRLHDRTY
jgi:uncharacterized membrane protein YgcG